MAEFIRLKGRPYFTRLWMMMVLVATLFQPALADSEKTIKDVKISIRAEKQSLKAILKQIEDKSGFVLDTTHAVLSYTPTGIVAKELYVKTPQSLIQHTLSITYDNIDELKTALEANKGYTVKLEGIYPGYEGSYGYPLNLGIND